MLFIPQEIKEKIDHLEQENKRLLEENERLQFELDEPHPPHKTRSLNYWSIGALVVALLYIIYLHWSMLKNKPADDPNPYNVEATIIKDGKLEKWNAAENLDVVYRVQLGAYEGFDLNTYKQNLDGLQQDSIDGFRKVSLGAFSQLADAQKFLKEVVRMGMENSYIVAYKNDTPIGLIEAKKLEK